MPTDWENLYQTGSTPWDKGAASPGLVEYLRESPLEGRILVPGCGAGHDVRAIANASPKATVTGLDIAPSAVERAKQFPASDQVTYLLADLFNLPAEMRGSFDAVWEHTCFCAIDPSMRPDYARAVREALKPGGTFLAIFYLDPYDDEHRPEDNRPPFGATEEELHGLFTPEHWSLEAAWVPGTFYPGREGGEKMWRMTRLG